eukprot:TRINITY_DN2800_c3_g1_i1.p4 TRINITY_DN2800_c3_g1~~TRINITY_DN2800_c3_g1_i1.p4  ORF type:complete len:424 (-),score=44.05 TRINITY_DN2800_c3_g1_i1:5033-6304(-)
MESMNSHLQSLEEEKIVATLNDFTLTKTKSKGRQNATKKPILLKDAIALQQIDEVLDYHPMSASERAQINEFLNKFDKENAYPHNHPEAIKHINFVRWVKSCGGILNKTKVVLYAKDYRGVHATVDIKCDEEIILIPIQLAISSLHLENTVLGEKLLVSRAFDVKWVTYLFPLIYVLDELLDPESKIKHWLEVIPKSADDHPMFFTEDEKKWLQGSPTCGILGICKISLEQLEIDKAQIKSFYEKIKAIDKTFGKSHSFDEFMRYFYILCSRFFGICEYDPNRAFLVPYADLINTNGYQGRNASWDYDPEKKMFRVVATTDIKAGDPLLFCYGHNSNFVYFTFYGMALPPAEYNSIAMIIKYGQSIPKGKLKAALLNDDITMTKKLRFYEVFTERIRSNLTFMEKCRFMWYSGNPFKICKARF